MVESSCLVIDLFRGTTHDGPGMRTTVFLKGCGLNCLWCQNPEGIKPEQEVWWDERKCIGCLACKGACPVDAITTTEDELHIDRLKCGICGACVAACPSQAIAFAGKEWTINQLVKEVLKDKAYYDAFGGGVTVSGGEPLNHYGFVAGLFKSLQALGVNTALDTCGLAPATALDSVLPYTDCVLFDIKIIDPGSHRKYTGRSNKTILDNLLYTAEYIRKANQGVSRETDNDIQGMKLWIRTPLIPETTATEENISGIGNFIRDNIIDVFERWELCSFNSICVNKYKKMGKTWAYENCGLMDQAIIDRLKAAALSSGVHADKLVVSGLIAKEE